ncbi:MAG: hypothetical protein KBT32_07505 [Bacteroidales bacterium]|nr:hypothetical protein [Candidatus Physcocola equi]
MYFIKCRKCNNLVEVKTEFLMLCPHCKGKLENNYQEWKQKKENKGKNFPTYLEEICISSEQIEEQQKAEKLEKMYSPKKHKTRKILCYVIAAIVCAVSVVLAVKFMPLLSEAWARNTMLGMNIGISLLGASGASILTFLRKKFQDFTPVFVSLATLLLVLIADMSFFVLTDSL